MNSSQPVSPSQRTLFGHPVGLYTLFFTEMWERASYYGTRALLVLFLVDTVTKGRGGLGMNVADATAIYGVYTGCVYLMTLAGGWIADRLLGQQHSVWHGGILIALGNYILAIPGGAALTYIGLTVIALGTGLLKPNISAIVGQLYPEGGARRDAGFSVFYSGINLGALVGPLIAAYFGERYNWHYGFLVAALGMTLGLVQYRLTLKFLGEHGREPHPDDDAARAARIQRRGWQVIGIGLVLLVALGLLLDFNIVRFQMVALAQSMSIIILIVAVLFFAAVLVFGRLDKMEKRRVIMIFLLFIAAAAFWSGFEQAGSSLNIFAETYTNREMGSFVIPAGWFQSVEPLFVIILSPIFGAMWVQLARKHLNPSIPAKFALGLLFLGISFLIMAGAADIVVHGSKALPTWLVMCYLFQTFGELCLSPVGLSSVTKLAPPRYLSQMMGTWFMADALGSVMAGLAAGRFDPKDVHEMPSLFMQVVYITVGLGILFAVFAKPIRKHLIGDIE
ncbi:MAG TPA: peptide MFS transporter [Gammaproteobacteria bacterium]|nr:peptide MFS transporter [Gammaproteobacteria bacterium]